MRAAGVDEIGLFDLGESFLCDWLEDAIAYATRRCGFPHVFLTTNGSAAAPERLQGCFWAGLDSLQFSYNHADGAQSEAIARVNQRALFGIGAARQSQNRTMK
jgi:MoaA/NifB/PqqE/SkfB family radical SAM enzyme